MSKTLSFSLALYRPTKNEHYVCKSSVLYLLKCALFAQVPILTY